MADDAVRSVLDRMKAAAGATDEPKTPATGNRSESFRRAAEKLGVDPVDLASIVSFETGGKFDPHIVGGEGNKYRGLIQFGPDEQKQYYRPGQSFEEQLEDGVVRFFQDRFKKVGMDTRGAKLEDLYTTVIAGNPKANRNARDAFGTSARSGAERIAREHRPNVLKNIFGGQVPNAAQLPDGAAGIRELVGKLRGGQQQPANTAQATPPVPEKPQTLDAQRKAMHDPRSSRASVLYTPGEQVPPPQVGETDIPLPDGSTLRSNTQKFQAALKQNGITSADLMHGRVDFTPLLGGKAEPTNDTAGKPGVVTRDARTGTELVASAVTDPNNIEKEAALQKAQFPSQPTTTTVEPGQAIVEGRMAGGEVPQIPGTETDVRILDEDESFYGDQKMTNMPFIAQVDPDYGVEEGQDRGEAVFRQALKQAGPEIMGRPLSELEINAITEFQRGKKGGFVFDRDSNQKREPFKGAFVIEGEDMAAWRDYLGGLQQNFEKVQREALRDYLAGGGELNDEAMREFEKIGLTRDKAFEIMGLNPNDFTVQRNEFQDEVDKSRETYEMYLDALSKHPDKAVSDNAATHARLAMKWITPDQAKKEIDEMARLRSEKEAEMLDKVRGEEFTRDHSRKFDPKIFTGKGADWQGRAQKEADTLLRQLISRHGSATNYYAVKQQEEKAEEARQARVAAMSWPEYLVKTYRDAHLNAAKSAVSTLVSGTLRGIALGRDLAQDVWDLSGTEITGSDPRLLGETRVEDLFEYKLADGIDSFLDTYLPTDKDLQQEFFAGKLPQGIGSTIGMMGGGFVGAAFKAPRVGVAVFSSLAMGGDAYKEARQAGASEAEAQIAGLLNAPLGLTEVVGIGSALKRLNSGVGVSTWQRLWGEAWRAGAKEIPEELGQEGFQTTASNIIAKLSYDPERKFDKDLYDNLITAGIAAPLASGGVTILNVARNRHALKKLIEQEQARGVIVRRYDDGELYVFDTPVDITDEIKPLVQTYDQTREGIEALQGQIKDIQAAARKEKQFSPEQKELLRTMWNLQGILKQLEGIQVETSKEIAAKAGVKVPEGPIIEQPGQADAEVQSALGKMAAAAGQQPATQPETQAEPEPETAQPAGPTIYVDKKGEKFEEVEDRGEKILVKNEKGGIVLRKKQGLTEVNEEPTIQEPAAPVAPEALATDIPAQGETSDVPVKQPEVSKKPKNVDTSKPNVDTVDTKPKAQPTGPITAKGLEIEPKEGAAERPSFAEYRKGNMVPEGITEESTPAEIEAFLDTKSDDDLRKIQKTYDDIAAMLPDGKQLGATKEASQAIQRVRDAIAVRLDQRKDEPKQIDALPDEVSSDWPERRKKGVYSFDGQTYERQPEMGSKGATGDTGKVKFAEGVEPEFTWVAVEADTLQPSHMGGNRNPMHFVPEAQPKSRTTDASKQAADSIAKAPNFKEITEGYTAFGGAPVTNTRGEVIQGNNRTEGLKQHYSSGGTQYRQDLLENAESFGLTREDVEGMKNPVLVRVLRVSDDQAIELGNYGDLDVTSGGKREIDPIQTARRMTPEQKQKLLDAIFLNAPEDATITQLIRDGQGRVYKQLEGILTTTQLETLTNEKGQFTPRGVENIKDVVLHLLYNNGDPDLPNIFENLLPYYGKKGVEGSLPEIFSVPPGASLVTEIQNGIIAAARFTEAKAEDFDAWSRQTDMFAGASPVDTFLPVELAIAKMLVAARTIRQVKNRFAEYAEAVNGTEGDMFTGATAGVSKPEAIKKVFGVEYVERKERETDAEQEADGRTGDEAAGRQTQEPEVAGIDQPATEIVRLSELKPGDKYTSKYSDDVMTVLGPASSGKGLVVENSKSYQRYNLITLTDEVNRIIPSDAAPNEVAIPKSGDVELPAKGEQYIDKQTGRSIWVIDPNSKQNNGGITYSERGPDSEASGVITPEGFAKKFERASDAPAELPTRAEFPNSLGIKREDMPQIREDDQPAFIEFAQERNEKVAPDTIAVKDLLPTQIEYNPRQAAQLPDNKLGKRLIVSADNRLLDGHNTLVRLREVDPNKEISILRIDLPAQEALELMKAFPKASFKSVKEVGQQSPADAIVARFKKVEADPGRATGEVADLSYQVRDYAETVKDEFWKDIQEVAETIPGATVPQDIYEFLTKTEKSLNKKLAIKKTAVPSDLLRSTIVIPPGPPERSTLIAAFVIDGMAKRGYKLYTDASTESGADVSNRFEDATPGYKDINLKFVKEGDPVVRELQLIQPAMFEAKKVGHHSYDRQKDIKDVAKNSSALTAEDKRVLQEESDKIDRYMAELYDAAYTEDTKSGSEYPAATSALRSKLPTLTIESMGPNGRFSLDSTPSMKEASELLLVLSSTHLSAARLSSTDIAANFFSVSGNIVGASNANIAPKDDDVQQKTKKKSKPKSQSDTKPTGAGLVSNALANLRKKKEAEKPPEDDAFADLDDLLGRPQKSALPVEQPFYQSQYDKYKPALAKAFDGIEGDSLQDRVNAFIEKLNERYDLAALEQLEPYLARFVDENVLPFIENESIEEVDGTDAANADRDGQTGDASQSPADVQGTASGGTAGSRGPRAGGSRSGGSVGTQKSGNESGSDVEGTGNKPDAGSVSDGKGSKGTDNRPGDGVSEQKPRRDYLAPAGSLTREGSWKTAATNNLDAIELAKKIEAENRVATPEEQKVLVKFVGWGASELANNVFIDPDSYKARSSPEWNDIRVRLNQVMTPEEIRTAQQSTQYAHYTSEKVIRGIWSALEQFGFAKGSILEPGMGIGLFPVAAPKNLIENSGYTGIELDSMTARIAKLLLPDQAVLENDFIKQKLPENHFDVAIGNPPFANIKIMADPKYKKHRFLLHDYFFAKSLDSVRPGGLLVFVTSKGTMDKRDAAAREYMAAQADLLGAIRLPQTAFKQNAGTEVVTDVLFFRKRMAGEEPGGQKWLGHAEITAKNEAGEDVTGLINEYYAEHPEMVLGEHAFTGSMYRSDEYTVTPREGDIEQHFLDAVKLLPKAVFAQQAKAQELAEATAERDWSPTAQKEGSLYVHENGRLMIREGGSGVALAATTKITPKEEQWLKDYVGLRTALKQAQYDQLNAEKEGVDWEASLAELNRVYDAFVKKHGNILAFTERETVKKDEDGNEISTIRRTFKNERLLAHDVEGPLVWTLEKVTDDGDIVKSNWLKDRQIKPPAPPKIETLNDALMVSLDTIGKLNIPHIVDLMAPVDPMTEQEVIESLGDLIYEEPGGGWVMADEYLSGNVKAKLQMAEAAASDPRFARNVEALRRVQPLPLPAEKITVQIGAPWVPADVVARFATEVLKVEGVMRPDPKATYRKIMSPAVEFDAATGRWVVPAAHGKGSQSGRKAGDWSTEDRNAAEILEAALNSESVTITKTEQGPPKRTYTDKNAAQAVQQKIEKMNQAFKPWLFSDPTRAKQLVALYNDKMNVLADRTFDGRHMTTPGLSLKFKLHDHVKRAIWRIIQTGNTYLAHAVGAGKTLEMIVSAMEQKRLGLISKPMFVVPNQVLKQFASEFLEAYPLANIMVADEQNFHTDNRKRFIAQAALNDLDAVIITHSAFGLLRSSEENANLVLKDLLAEMEEAMDALTTGTDSKGNPVGDSMAETATIKRIQARIEAITQKFLGRMNSNRDNVLNFEELGVDFLYVDEAHEFRKLDFTTSQTNLKGVDPAGSMKALDLLVKSRWLDSQRPGRSMVLASGTPITNTMAELFSIQRFLGHKALIEDGLDHFDMWAKQFGEVEENIEANAAGGYKAVKRFSKFVNTGVLMQRVRAFMDVVTLSQLSDLIKVPKIKLNSKGKAAPEVVVTERTELLEQYLSDVLAPRIEASEKWKPTPQEKYNPDPLIAIISDGQHAAFDMRYIYPESPNDPNSKLNKMIDGIIESYHAHNDLEYINKATGEPYPIKGAAHIVFSFGGFGQQVIKNRGFDSKRWMKQRLVEAGIPANEIAFIWDYPTSTAKEAVFKEVREGKKKILVGDPRNMGTGVNAQTRLKTLHFGMAPWFPAHVEQPHGRIIRHGNQNEEIEIYWYAAKGTYDEAQWGMIARKSKAIEDAMTGNYDGDVEDISESSQYAMASALASGDPRALRLAELRGLVEKYNRLENAHNSARAGAFAELREIQGPTGISDKQKKLERLEAAIKIAPAEKVSKENFEITIDGETFNKDSDKTNAELGQMLKNAWQSVVAKNYKQIINANGQPMKFTIANVFGKMQAEVSAWTARSGIETRLVIRIGEAQFPLIDGYQVSSPEIANLSESGLITRIVNVINGLNSEKTQAATRLAELEQRRDEIISRLDAPFEFETEASEARAEMNALILEMTNAGIALPPALTAKEIEAIWRMFNIQKIRADRKAREDAAKQAMGSVIEGRPLSLKSALPARPEQTETPEFKRWFGDSKVVDADGNPLAVYHGTADDIQEFRIGTNFKQGHGKQIEGIYFSQLASTASAYARSAANAKDASTEIDGANVIPAYVSLQNPLFVGTANPDFTKRTKADLEQEGYDGVIRRNADGDFVEIIAFHPTQIKSAIGNSGAFGPNNANILASKLTPEERGEIIEEMRRLPFAEWSEILSNPKFDRTGGRLMLNANAHEIYRRTLEELKIRSKEIKRGSGDYEDLFKGLFIDNPETVDKMAAMLDEKAAEAKGLGYTSAEVKALADAAAELRAAAQAGDGTVVLYTLPEALPHELFHQTDFQNAADKSILNRHSDRTKDRLDRHKVAKVLWDQHFSKLNEYKRLKPGPYRDALIRSEVVPYLLESSEEQLAAMGLTPDMVDDYILTWFEGYAEKNGLESLDSFENEELNVERFTQQAREAVAERADDTDGPTRSEDEGYSREPTDEPTRPAGRDEEGDRGGPREETIEPDDFEQEVPDIVLQPGQRLRSLPATMRAAGIQAIDEVYEIYRDKAATADAVRLLEQYGIEGSIRFLDDLPASALDAQHAFLSFMVIRTLLNHSEAIRDTNPAEANRRREQALKLASSHSRKATGAGRFTRIPSVIGPTTETLVYSVQAILDDKYKGDKTLSPERWAYIESLGRQLEESHALLTDARNEKRKLKGKITRLENKLAGKERAKPRNTAARKRLVKLIEQKIAPRDKIEDLAAQLRAKFAPAAATAPATQTQTQKSVLADDTFPIDELAQVGAMRLLDGLAQDWQYTPDEFRADMLAEFGASIEPHLPDIYKAAWETRDAWLEQVRKEKRYDKVREDKKNPDLTDDEIEAILGERREQRARRRAIETYHKRESKAVKRSKDYDAIIGIIADKAANDKVAIVAAMLADKRTPAQISAALAKLGIDGDKEYRKIIRDADRVLREAKAQHKQEMDAAANELLEAKNANKSIDDLRWDLRRNHQKINKTIEAEVQRVRAGEAAYRVSQLADASNAFRTMMASFDLSAALRQGGFFMFAAPELQKQAWVNMFSSIRERGYGRTIMDIENNPLFAMAQRSGIDFAMAGRMSDEGSSAVGEELFRGEPAIEKVPLIGTLITQGIVKPSERTYTAFLDTQRMIMFETFARELMDSGYSFDVDTPEFKAIARFINIATGRGTMPGGRMGRLILDLPFFAPRYTLSRFQLLNITLNPVAYYRLPAGARKIVLRSALRFYGTLGAVMGIATAFGLVSWDDDDGDFGKIKIGNTRYDLFAGLLQPARMLIRLVHAAVRGNRLPGEMGDKMINEIGRFFRGKLSPIASLGVDAVTGSDYVGQEFQALPGAVHRLAGDEKADMTELGGIMKRLLPLTLSEIGESYQVDGWTGPLKAVPPAFFGIGASTYKSRPEMAVTEAEKLAAKAASWKFNKRGAETPEEKKTRELVQDLVARSRSGEYIAAEVDQLMKDGKITYQHRIKIRDALQKTFLEDKAEGLDLEMLEAVMKVASERERKELMPILNRKMKDAEKGGTLLPEQKQRLESMGGRITGYAPMPPAVSVEFDRHEIKIPDVAEKITVYKGQTVPLDDAEYDKYRREALTEIYSRVQDLVNSREYIEASPEAQKEMIEKQIRKGRTTVQKETKANLRDQVRRREQP